MTTRLGLQRRALLRAGALGGFGLLAAACGPSTRAPASPQPATPLPKSDLTATAPAPVQATAADVAPAATAIVNTPAADLPEPTPAPQPTAAQATSTFAAGIAAAAKGVLDGLDDAQRKQSVFAFDDAERLRWHWTNTSAFPRNGLALRDVQPLQREAALALLRASVSEAGFSKSVQIMQLQTEINGDPENYYVSFFGVPGEKVWGWRFEGHHLSRHFTIAGDKVSITPFFHGVWPSVSAAGKRIMQREEWAARELIRSLDDAGRASVVFQDSAPGRHLTWNDNYVQPLEAAGAPLAALDADQQALAMEVLQTWMNTQAAPIASMHMDRINAAGLDNIRFAWAGSMEERRPHYYRIQGPSFLMEYDNSRNGATHIHSVWRVFDQDFGQGLA